MTNEHSATPVSYRVPGWAQRLHYAAFVGIYSAYGYQVCPYLDNLSLAQIAVPAMLTMLAHALLSGWLHQRIGADGKGQAVQRIFLSDWALFVGLGIGLAAFNLLVHGFPPGSGGKVLFGYLALGLYISLDMALRRDLHVATTMRATGRDYPITDQFMPYQTKLILFSAMNVGVMAVVGLLVTMKDLIWVRQTELTDSQVQALVLFDALVVIGVLAAYILLVIRQYSRKVALALDEENSALDAVRKGDLSSRVAVVSNDEFGQLANLTNGMIGRLSDTLDEVARSRSAIIQALVALAAKRDNETGLHLKRTQMYVRLLAEHLQLSGPHRQALSDEQIETIIRAAPLHDIGKVGVPDAVLRKPGRLTEDEFEIMKTHAQIGADALREANTTLGGSSFIEAAIEIAEAHHERWDGAGYPHGLKGEAIPLSARIMAVADVYDAIRTKRVYKPSRDHGDARSIIVDGSGAHFDPVIVEAFLDVEHEFERIADAWSDDAQDTSRSEARDAA
ncbi:MAG: HD domain-containing protein [Devosiaceae bacterium]|nr:HD domain-containing protein [Devosiaceae bacterium MH13]